MQGIEPCATRTPCVYSTDELHSVVLEKTIFTNFRQCLEILSSK